MKESIFQIETAHHKIHTICMFNTPTSLTQLEELMQCSIHEKPKPDWFDEWLAKECKASPIAPQKFEDVVLQYEDNPSEGLPLLKVRKPYRYRMPEDPELRRTLSPFFMLAHLLNEFVYSFPRESWNSDEEYVAPSNLHLAYTHEISPKKDPHQHVITLKSIIPLLLNEDLLFGIREDAASGTFYALHPIFGMPPEALLAHLRSQESLTSLIQEYFNHVLNNLSGPKITWYPVFEGYTSETYRPTRVSSHKDIYCECCGMSLAISASEIRENTLHVIAGTSDYALEMQEPSLLICKGRNYLDHYKATVQFPSGNLIFADWIRYEKFTKAVKREDQYNTSKWHSINYKLGRFQEMQHKASLNIVFGGIGNEAVNLYKFDGGIVIAGKSNLDLDYWEPEKDVSDEEYEILFAEAKIEANKVWETTKLTPIGSICTDLWGYIVVDIETIGLLTNQTLKRNRSKIVDSEKRALDLEVSASKSVMAGGSTVGYRSLPPGEYTHYYLRHFSVEKALTLLPEHIAQLIEPYQFRTIHAVLLKI